MADTDEAAAEPEADGAEGTKKKKGGKGGLIIGLVLAIALGAGAAFAVMSGLVPIPGGEEHAAEEDGHKKEEEEHKPKPSFVALDPLTVTIGKSGAPRQLRIALTIETTEHYAPDVEETRPRILDALNTLLRAVEETDLSQPWSLDRLRAQMLRRIRIATDPTAIQDLLITEYVIF